MNKTTLSFAKGIAKGGAVLGGGMLSAIGSMTAALGITLGSVGAVPIVIGIMFGNVEFTTKYVRSTWRAGAISWVVGANGLIIAGLGTAGISAGMRKSDPSEVVSATECDSW